MAQDFADAFKSLHLSDVAVISILTYNVLAPSLAKASWFPYCDRKYLNWKYRRSRLVADIFSQNTDVICLQEVEHYLDFWRPAFEKRGYVSYFHHKPAPHLYGLVIAFKKERFVKVEYVPVFFCQHAWTENTSSIAQMLAIRDKTTDTTFLLANVHLWWAPEGRDKDRRFFQAAVLYEKMISLSNQLQHSTKNSVIGLCCGDFNSVPTDGVYASLTQVNQRDKEFVKKCLSISESNEKHFDDAFRLFHEGPWECVYSSSKLNVEKNCTPPWTNYTKLFKGVLDYIFVLPLSEINVRLVSLRKQPEEKISKLVGLPSREFPSDHLPVVAKFEIER